VGLDEFTVSVCDGASYVWKNPYGIEGPGHVNNFNQGSGHHGTARSNGTDGSVEVIGNGVGDNTVSFDIVQDSNGAHVHVILHVHVIDCRPHKHGGLLGGAISFGVGVGMEAGEHHDDDEDRGHHVWP
jgi:hypothetical protein